MPNYDFKCETCKTIVEIFLPIIKTKERNWDKIPCAVCKAIMIKTWERAFNNPSDIPSFQFHGGELAGKSAVKAKRASDEAIHIASQPFESRMEQEEGMGLAKERETLLNKSEGSLTTGVKANPNDKEYKYKIKKRDEKKKDASRKMRRKAGI